MLFWYLGVVLLTGSSVTSAERRVQVGKTVQSFEIPSGIGSADSNQSLVITEMQADEYLDGNILVAVGNSIYTVQPKGQTTLIVGSGVDAPAGYADGGVGEALFNNIGGFVQLPGDLLLIADENNQCIRQMHRYSGVVSTYAGRCNYTHFYDQHEYLSWQTFNKPTKLAADQNYLIYAVDMLESNEKYIIMTKYLGGAFDRNITLTTNGSQVNDFIYDDQTDTLAVSSDKGVTNSSIYTHHQTQKFKMDGAFGLASYDGVLIVTNHDSDTVTFFDGYDDWSNFTICDSTDVPACSVNKPTAAAVTSGWLYIGSSVGSDEGNRKAVVTKISFSTPGHPGLTTPWIPTIFPTAVPYDSGLGLGGLIAIIIGGIVFVGLMICLITCCVRRNLNRTSEPNYVSASVTVQPSSRVPYGKLQEA